MSLFRNPDTSNSSSWPPELVGLNHNRFEGSIPESIFELSSLRYLDLSSNKLNGSVDLDMIGRLRTLIELDLSYNSLTVNLSSRFTFTHLLPHLTTLRLASCNITGANETPADDETYIFDWRMALSIGVGFGVGFVAVVIPLIFSDKVDLWYDIFVCKLMRGFHN